MKTSYKALAASAIIAAPEIALAANDFGQIADNLRTQFDNFALFLTALTYIAGLYYTIVGFIMLRTGPRSGDGLYIREYRIRYACQIVCGLVLLFFPTVLQFIETTIFGSYNAVTATVNGILYT